MEWTTFPLPRQGQVPVDHDVDLRGAVGHGPDHLLHTRLQWRLAGWETGRHCGENVFTARFLPALNWILLRLLPEATGRQALAAFKAETASATRAGYTQTAAVVTSAPRQRRSGSERPSEGER